jgi:hypothetical protein
MGPVAAGQQREGPRPGAARERDPSVQGAAGGGCPGIGDLFLKSRPSARQGPSPRTRSSRESIRALLAVLLLCCYTALMTSRNPPKSDVAMSMSLRQKPKPKSELARSTLYLDQELWNEARKAAIDEGVPVTRLVERLIREYLERRKRR